MGALFRLASNRVATFAVYPVTPPPAQSPEYLADFLAALPAGSLRDDPAANAAELAHAISSEPAHILLDGLWRKECVVAAKGHAADTSESDGRRLACALLHTPAPTSMSVLAAPITAGGKHLQYTLGDPACLPPRLSRAFAERFVLLPAGAYPFDHAHWAPEHRAPHGLPHDVPARRADEGLRSASIVLASFVQRWKANPLTWACWSNALRRGPVTSALWLLQHPLDGEARALTGLLRRELADLDHTRRLVVMRRQPLRTHLRRVRLADLVVDTWPYTAHTTAADSLWAHGPPWLALAASDDRMDSLLSKAVLTSVGGLPLATSSLREFEDVAVALIVP